MGLSYGFICYSPILLPSFMVKILHSKAPKSTQALALGATASAPKKTCSSIFLRRERRAQGGLVNLGLVFLGKSTENHGFDHEIWWHPVNMGLEQRKRCWKSSKMGSELLQSNTNAS